MDTRLMTEAERKKLVTEAIEYVEWASSMLNETEKLLENHRITCNYRRNLVDEYYYLQNYIRKVRANLNKSIYSEYPQYYVNTHNYDRSFTLSL